MRRGFVYWLIGVLVYLIIPLSTATAAGEFRADYDVNYSVAPNLTTIVTQSITLTNLLTNLYAKQYEIIIDSDKIKNIIAYDGGGVINPTIATSEGKTTIGLIFNEQIVGIGKSIRFTLRYESATIAVQNGTIWEIQIPGVASSPDLGEYWVTLSVPQTFGVPTYTVPKPFDGRKWNKNQMTKGGVSVAYGSKQHFALDLKYFIENPTVTRTITEIALPPDTAFQKITVRSIIPEPDTVVKDVDGNWLARYMLTPGQKLNIEAQLIATLTFTPRSDFTQVVPDITTYTTPIKYWESQNNEIMTIAQNLTTPRAIYDYVVDTLSYSYDRINQNPKRRGAIGALNNPTEAICMEFTDLFIALARAAGIPTRQAVGYAHTSNTKLRPLSLVSDILHAWPEYYDQERNLWIPIDPTWADTTGGLNYFDTLDFNHVVFAINGLDSSYPYPAGFYKESDKTGKDVNVRFANIEPTTNSDIIQSSIDFPDKVTPGLTARGEVLIQNNSGQSITELAIELQSIPGNVDIQRTEYNVPPYSKITIPFEMKLSQTERLRTGTVVVVANNSLARHTFTIQPLWLILLPTGAVVIGALILLWIVRRRRL